MLNLEIPGQTFWRLAIIYFNQKGGRHNGKLLLGPPNTMAVILIVVKTLALGRLTTIVYIRSICLKAFVIKELII